MLESSPIQEQAYEKWRCYVDLFTLPYHWIARKAPSAYWILRASLCDDHDLGFKPFARSIAKDDLLNTFPCGNSTSNTTYSSVRKEQAFFNLFSSLNGQPPESLAWFSARWWWASIYILTRHAFWSNAPVLLLTPLWALVPWIAPAWWVSGGRAACVVLWRWYGIMTQLVMFSSRGVSEAITLSGPIGRRPPLVFAMHQAAMRPVLAAVPWRLQVPQTLLEIPLLVLVCIAHQGYSPPSFWWVMQAVAYAVAGSLAGLAISLAETIVLEASLGLRCATRFSDGMGRDAQFGILYALKQLVVAAKDAVPRQWTRMQIADAVWCAVVVVCVVVLLATYDMEDAIKNCQVVGCGFG